MITRDQLENGIIIFKCPDNIHRNYGIEIYHPTKTQMINQFETSCVQWFKNIQNTGIDLQWYRQGRDATWCYFEFWNGEEHQDLLLDWAETLSEVHELPLEIE